MDKLQDRVSGVRTGAWLEGSGCRAWDCPAPASRCRCVNLPSELGCVAFRSVFVYPPGQSAPVMSQNLPSAAPATRAPGRELSRSDGESIMLTLAL